MPTGAPVGWNGTLRPRVWRSSGAAVGRSGSACLPKPRLCPWSMTLPWLLAPSVIRGVSMAWSGKNVTIGQAGVGAQVTDSFATMASAMLVTIGLVYLILVILVRLLLVPLVILCTLLLAVVGAFVALAVTGRALDLSALVGLLMLSDIVITNAIVLHGIEAGADVRTALMQGGRTHVRPILMTTAATILALIQLAPSSDDDLIPASLATVVIGGLLSSGAHHRPPRAHRHVHPLRLRQWRGRLPVRTG
jgi:AcrB/AcrD/AcrF family